MSVAYLANANSLNPIWLEPIGLGDFELTNPAHSIKH